MKKTICLLCVLAVALSLVGCKSKKNENAVIEIEGNPTTGYEWTAKADNEGIVSIGVEYKQDASADNKTGVGGKYTFTIAGVKEGQTNIVFTYSRSWEPDEVNDETKTYQVTVDKNLNVTVK